MDSIEVTAKWLTRFVASWWSGGKLASLLALFALVWSVSECSMSRAEELADGTPSDSAITQAKRPLWMNSHIHGTPDPADPYRLENAFPNLALDEPLAVSQIEGTNLFVIGQRYGKIFRLEDAPQAKPQLLMDLGRVVYGVAAHPDFLHNGRLFVTSVTKEWDPDGTRLSRFESTAEDRFRVDPKSEVVLLTWPAGGHNGGCVRFGPDGLLYASTGDASGWADWNLTGQRIDESAA